MQLLSRWTVNDSRNFGDDFATIVQADQDR